MTTGLTDGFCRRPGGDDVFHVCHLRRIEPVVPAGLKLLEPGRQDTNLLIPDWS